MRKFFLVLLLLAGFNVQAQYSYSPIELCKGANSESEYFVLSKKDTVFIHSDRENNRQVLNFKGQSCKAENQDEVLEYRIFANQKEKRAFLLVNRTNEVSFGCDIFMIEPNRAVFCGFLPVAAYTKDPNGRMDYNNIVPYISIIRVSDRYLFAFETPLIVLYPSGEQEEILNGRNISYSYRNQALELHR